MPQSPTEDKKLGKTLILDELFDLSLYKVFQNTASGPLRATLDELIPIETKHHAFWQEFFKMRIEKLNFTRRLKLGFIVILCKIFGEAAIYMILEAIEVYGIRKYLNVWKTYQYTPLADAVKEVLEDEFKHEDQVVSGVMERKINPENIRDIFLGFNDGLIEFTGAVAGFFAAFQDAKSVLIAGVTGAVAGSLSMAVGAYMASGSQKEIEETEAEKNRFFTQSAQVESSGESPLKSAFLVGCSTFVGAMVPILPIFFGAKNVLASCLLGGAVVVLVSLILSFISGMDIKKRVATNLAMVTGAIAAAYLIGSLVEKIFGINAV